MGPAPEIGLNAAFRIHDVRAGVLRPGVVADQRATVGGDLCHVTTSVLAGGRSGRGSWHRF